MNDSNKFVVDRIEEDMVVLISGTNRRIIPVKKFEQDVAEGDVVDLNTLKADKDITQRRKGRVIRLIDQLFRS